MGKKLSMTGVADKYGIDKSLVRRTMAACDDFPAPVRFGRILNFDEDEVANWLLTNDWARGNIEHRPDIIPRVEAEAAAREAASGIPFVPESVKKIQEKNALRDAKSRIQTEILQLELDKKKAKLVLREDVVSEFAPKIARLAKSLEMIPNLFGKKWGLTNQQIKEMVEYLDDIRLALTRDDGGILSENYEPETSEDE